MTSIIEAIEAFEAIEAVEAAGRAVTEMKKKEEPTGIEWAIDNSKNKIDQAKSILERMDFSYLRDDLLLSITMIEKDLIYRKDVLYGYVDPAE